MEGHTRLKRRDMHVRNKLQSRVFSHNTFGEEELQYENTLVLLEDKINEDCTTNKTNVILPKVKIPIFEGGYDNWTTFHDIFLKLVHTNSSLIRIEKIQYRKTHVKGEASRIIQHLLKNRYHNKRLLLSKLIYKILDLPTIQDESAEKIKQLHDVTNECLETVNNLEINTKIWGPLISRIVVRKWDSETNKLHEQSQKQSNKIQDFEKLMEFLKTRFQMLEAMNESKKSDITTDTKRSGINLMKTYVNIAAKIT